MKNKISFCLMTYKGYFVLQQFVNNFSTRPIECVISARDFHIQKDYYDEIKSFCLSNDILFFDRKEPFRISSEYVFCIGWRWIIESDCKIIVFHDSLLPKYRGFNPLVTSLINGDREIGVTALIASTDYDRGDIISQKEISVRYPIKIKMAIDKILPIYFSLVEDITKRILNNSQINYIRQNNKLATYSLWRDDQDYHIDWKKDAKYLVRLIDAVGDPYLGAYSFIDNIKARILNAESLADVVIANRTPGKIIFIENGLPVVVCGKGLLKITGLYDDKTKNSLLPFKKFRTRFV